MRNFKVLYIDPDVVLTVLGNWQHYTFLRLPIIKNLPEGAKILSVDYSVRQQAFGLLIQHHSFPDVPLYYEIPPLEIELMFETVELKNVSNPTARPVYMRSDVAGNDPEHPSEDNPTAA